MKPLAETFAIAALGAHALAAAMTGSLNPGAWGAPIFWTMVLVVAPLIGLGVATLKGAFQ